MVGVCCNFVRLRSSKHTRFDCLLDELGLSTRYGNPATVQRVGFRHVPRLWKACRPGESTTRQFKGLVAVIEPFAKIHLFLGELWARIFEVVVAQSLVALGLC